MLGYFFWTPTDNKQSFSKKQNVKIDIAASSRGPPPHSPLEAFPFGGASAWGSTASILALLVLLTTNFRMELKKTKVPAINGESWAL